MRLRSRMILSILLTVAIPAAVLMVVGGWLLWYRLGEEAGNRVRLDLNAAREFYEHRRELMEGSLRYTVLGGHFARAVASGDLGYVAPRLTAVPV